MALSFNRTEVRKENFVDKRLQGKNIDEMYAESFKILGDLEKKYAQLLRKQGKKAGFDLNGIVLQGEAQNKFEKLAKELQKEFYALKKDSSYLAFTKLSIQENELMKKSIPDNFVVYKKWETKKASIHDQLQSQVTRLWEEMLSFLTPAEKLKKMSYFHVPLKNSKQLYHISLSMQNSEIVKEQLSKKKILWKDAKKMLQYPDMRINQISKTLYDKKRMERVKNFIIKEYGPINPQITPSMATELTAKIVGDRLTYSKEQTQRNTKQGDITAKINDSLPVDVLLRNESPPSGNAVCRNYAETATVVFEAIKSLLPPDNFLVNAYLVPTVNYSQYFGMRKVYMDNTKESTKAHAWNTLYVLMKEDVITSSTIDITFADNEPEKVKIKNSRLDYTSERHLNEDTFLMSQGLLEKKEYIKALKQAKQFTFNESKKKLLQTRIELLQGTKKEYVKKMKQLEKKLGVATNIVDISDQFTDKQLQYNMIVQSLQEKVPSLSQGNILLTIDESIERPYFKIRERTLASTPLGFQQSALIRGQYGIEFCIPSLKYLTTLHEDGAFLVDMEKVCKIIGAVNKNNKSKKGADWYRKICGIEIYSPTVLQIVSYLM